MRTAAGRSGLGLAAASAREKISSSLFVRRSSAIAKKKSELGLNEDKSLYLCFREKSFYYVNQVVRPVRLKNSDDDEGGKAEEYLLEAAYKTSVDTGEWRFSGRFGSQILFPSGRIACTHINRVDTSSEPIKFEDSTTEFSSPKIDPALVELNGKLYCIDKGNPSRPFEVLDPEDNDCKWRALAKPPFSIKRNGSSRPFYTSILEESNKILAWEQGKAAVDCFDVTKPENGWKQSSFSLATTLPKLGFNGGPLIFIHNHHPDIGAFYLTFSYDYRGAPLIVSPIFMSHSC